MINTMERHARIMSPAAAVLKNSIILLIAKKYIDDDANDDSCYDATSDKLTGICFQEELDDLIHTNAGSSFVSEMVSSISDRGMNRLGA